MMEIFRTSAVVFLTLLLLISSIQGHSPYYIRSLSIDCGATTKSIDNATFRYWLTDEEFIKTGEIQFLPAAKDSTLYQMKTLRSFPSGDRNCYKLVFKPQFKFLLRAGFYYGNYDGRQKPPRFVLELDRKFNATVVTSMSEDDPVYVELVFWAEKEIGEVCLVRTQSDNVPFISTLESTNLYDDSEPYRLMQNHTGLYLEARVNYGANNTFQQQFSEIADPYNRLWKPEQVSGYRNIAPSYDVITLSSYARTENYPPFAMLHYAIEAYKTSQSIVLPVKFHDNSRKNISAYFVFYFADFEWNPNITGRTVAIYIDGDEKNVTEILPWYNDTYPVVSVYPVSVKGGKANVTISAAEGNKLPPILSGMEVFSVMQSQVSSKAVHDSYFHLASLFCFLVLALA